MSDSTPPSRAGRHDGVPGRDEASHLTLSPNAPLRPEAGSPLDLLVRRQSLSAARSGGLLGYVPAQVR